MPEALKFFVNTSASDVADALVLSFGSQAPALAVSINQRDTARPIELHFLKENPNFEADGAPFVYVDPIGTTADIAIGQYLQPVTGGTFTITDPGAAQTTAIIAWNATAAVVQAAIRVALTTNFSLAIVTGDDGGPWVVDRGTTGAYIHDLTGGTDGLTPVNSVAEVVNLQDGTSKINERWQIALLQPPAVLAALSGAYLPAAAIGIGDATAGSVGVNAVQAVTWNPDAYAGAVSMTALLPTGNGIVSASAANPTIVTTAVAHNLRTGESVVIAGNSQGALNATLTATVISGTTFSVPVNLTGGAGSGGTVSVSRTVGPIAYNAGASDMVTALAAHGASSATAASFGVIQNGPGDYAVTFQGPLSGLPIQTMGGTANLKVPLGLAGTVNCNTEGILAILGGSAQTVTNLQISQTAAGIPSVLAIRNDAILRASLIPVGAVSSEPLSGTTSIDPATGALINPSALMFCNANNIPMTLPGVIGYTGGAGNLDGVPTLALSAPWVASIVHATDGLRNFQYRTGTDAPVARMIIRPADYNAATHPFQWYSV